MIVSLSFHDVTGQNVNGYLWEDTNGNGVQDGGEAPIDGVTVELIEDASGTVIGTDVTGSVNAGEYSIAGATAGVDYRLNFTDVTASADPNYVPTTFQAGGDITIDSDADQSTFNSFVFTMPGGDQDDMDAGFYVTVEVGDLVWLDDNGNGQDDDGPISLSGGVDVTLYRDDGTGTFNVANDFMGNPLPSNPINTTDNYLFDQLAPGNYRVEFTDGSGSMMFYTYEDYSGGNTQASDVADDSDAQRANGQSHEFQLNSGDGLYDQVDAGYMSPYSISGYVWHDQNGDGQDNEGAAATPNPVDVTLEIESPFGSGTWVTATDEYNSAGTLTNPVAGITGNYQFLNLPPGNYRVLFSEPGDANPADMHLTISHYNDGGVDVGDDADDSDADRVAVGGNGISHEILCTNARGSNTVDNVNAGYFLPVRIGDFVFEDMNGDGDQTGDAGLPNPIDISLFRMDLGDVPALDVDGNPYVVPINQNGAGIYEFFPLPPGEYQVQFDWTEPDVFPTEMDAVADDIDSDIMDCNAGGGPGTSRTPTTAFLLSDQEDLTIDAGFFQPVRISDFVWEDLNANGLQDGGEPGLDGVQVDLFEAITMAGIDDAMCIPVASAITAGGGLYEFINLRPGDYVVQFTALTVPDQYYISEPDRVGAAGTFAGDSDIDSDADQMTGLTFDIPTVSADDIDIIDCGMFRAASIGDFCWHDENGNGIQDGEPPLGGVTISIIDVNTGIAPNDLTTGAPVPNEVSDGAGMYLFDNIPPGEYQLTFTEPAPDWFVTRVNQSGGPDDATDTPDDSDADEANANATHNILLESGEMEEDIDAGFFKAAFLGDQVWHDGNADGIRDATETNPVPAGVTITVIDLIMGGTAIDVSGNPAVINVPPSGFWQFTGPTGLKPGNYDVMITIPGMWFVSDPDQTGDDFDSDFIVGANTLVTPLTLLSEDEDYTVDAGIYKNITVGGFVFSDTDGDCMFDPTIEMAFPNDVVLSLIDDIGDLVAQTNTDNMGMYMFMDVKPGDYTIELGVANWDNTAPLFNLIPCGPANDPNDDVPLDNNGDGPNGGPVVTPVIELICGEEPGGDGTENKTIDFGFEFDCNTANNPYAYLTCTEAADNPICNVIEFEQGCGTMPDFDNPIGPNPLCPGGGGIPHNTSWFSFIAGYGDYDIEIALNGCNPGTGGSTGIQSGLYLYDPDNADCWGNIAPYCEDGCSGGDIILPGDDLIPGQQYLMFLDGCNGSYCGYEINILGDFQPFIVNPAAELTCNGNTDCEVICPGTEITFEANDVDDTYDELENLLFDWQFTDQDGNVFDFNSDPDDWQTTENTISYTFDEVGTYEICLVQISDRCENVVPVGLCQTIEVIEIVDEDFGMVHVCENLISVYQGPHSVNDEGIVTDPNMDLFDGWQNPTTIFVPGFNQTTITTPLGCVYDQQVFVEPLLNGIDGLLDTAVCGMTEFPMDVLNTSISGPIEGFFYQEFGGAANGCDTSMTINAFLFDVQGDVELVGCVPNGFELLFVQESITNTYNSGNSTFPTTYEWFDAVGDPIADDGDGNPFTIVVPEAGNYCIVASISSEFFRPDVDEIVCPFQFCFDLNTDNFLPPSPEAEAWQDQFCEYDNTGVYIAESDEDPADVTFNWTYPGDVASVTGQNTDTLTIDWAGSAGGEVCVTLTNACGTSEPICDTIVIVPTPIAAILPMDSICVDSLTNVGFSGTDQMGYSYGWNFGGGTPVGTTDVPGPIDVSWSEPGTKTVSLTVTHEGCQSSEATSEILVVEPVAPPVITCTSTIDQVIFTWNDPAGQTGYTPTILGSSTNVGDGGVLSGNMFTISNLNVADQVDITLVVSTNSPCGDLVSTGTCTAQDCPANLVTPTPVDAICVDANTQTINLTATLDNPINGDYNWSGPGITDAVNGVFDPQQAMEGTNTIAVTFTDENQCVYNSVLNIEVNPTPTSDFIADKITICQDSSLSVEYTGSITTGGQFDWTFDDVAAPGNGPGPFDLSWLTPGDKTITLSVTKAGCPSEETMMPVTVDPRIEPLDIDCEEQSTSIGISWNDLDNVTGYDLYIDNVLVTPTPTDNSHLLDGLTPLTEVDILLVANSDNACPGVELMVTCQAVDCPPIDIEFNVTDTTLCLDATALPFQLAANVTGGPGLGGEVETWSGTGVDPTTGIFDPSAAGVGTHTINFLYEEANCSEESSLTVTIINQPTSDMTAPPVICVTDALTIDYTGTAPNLPFEWTVEDGTLTKVGATQYSVQWAQAGTYDISLQVGQGTCLSDVSMISVQVDPEMVPVDVSCESTLNSITFNWNDIDCASEYEVAIDGNVVGTQSDLTYALTGLNEGDMAEITITPIEECECPAIPISLECEARACPPVQLSLSSPVTEFCVGTQTSNITLGVNIAGSENPGTGSWSGDGNVTADGVFDPNGQQPGLYTFTYDYNESGCDFSETTTIEIFENPNATATPTDPTCYLDQFGSINVEFTGGNGTAYDTLLNGNAVTSANLASLSPGTYTVSVVDEEGCSDETSVTIMSALEAQLQIQGATIIKAGESGTLTTSHSNIDGAIDSIVWTLDGTMVECDDPICNTIPITPQNEVQEYCATIYYNDGCTVDECVTIRIVRSDVIILPNVVYPNSGFVNNTFFVPGYETIVSVKSMSIFDRWGNKMFKIENVPAGDPVYGWNGMVNGKAAAQGVYVYTVELELENGDLLTKSGDVTVLDKKK